jgi:hypothetical protein
VKPTEEANVTKPNTDEGAPANASDSEPNQADQDGSPGDGASGDQDQDGQAGLTLEQRVNQGVQGVVDQNRAYLQQGRYSEMNPKLVELLGDYDKLRQPAGTSQSEPKKEYGPGFEDRSGQEDPRLTELAAEGLKSRQREVVGQIATQVEQDILKENWAEDIKALFAEYGKSGISDDDWQAIDPTNRTTFPFNRVGYRTWLTAANAYRVRQIVAKAAADAEGDGGEGDSTSTGSAVDKDRATAGSTKRKPQVKSAGQGAQDLKTMAKQRRDGKGPDDAEFRERIRQTIAKSGMGGSSRA